jgi:hypothetical protein
VLSLHRFFFLLLIHIHFSTPPPFVPTLNLQVENEANAAALLSLLLSLQRAFAPSSPLTLLLLPLAKEGGSQRARRAQLS